MTCIVALVQDGEAWMGADSCCVGGHFGTPQRESKVFQHGDLLVGGSGQKRAAQIIRYLVEPPAREGRPTHKYLVQSWIPAVRAAIREHGHERTQDGADELNGAFLVAAHDGVFFVGGDFGVDSMGDFGASGSGEEVATGALMVYRSALLRSRDLTPREVLRMTLRITEECISTVCGPFNILQLEQQ